MSELLRPRFQDASGGIAPRSDSVLLASPEGNEVPVELSRVTVVCIKDTRGRFYLTRREPDHIYAPGKLDMMGQPYFINDERGPVILANGLADYFGFPEIRVNKKPFGTFRRVAYYPHEGQYRDTTRTFLAAYVPRSRGVEAQLEEAKFIPYSVKEIEEMPEDEFRRPEVRTALIYHHYHKADISRGKAKGFSGTDPDIWDPNVRSTPGGRYMIEAMKSERAA